MPSTPSTARVTTPDVDGFELLWWSPTLGPLHGHPDGRIRDTDLDTVDELPLDVHALTPLHDHAAAEETLLRKLHPSVRNAFLADETCLRELAEVIDRACPDGAIGHPRGAATHNLATRRAAAARYTRLLADENNLREAVVAARLAAAGRRVLDRR